MTPIRTIIFDMGGVLLDLDRQASIDAFAAAGYARAGEMLDPYVQTGFFLQLEKGLITSDKLYATIRQQSGKEIADEAIAEALFKFVAGLPVYKLQMLLDLREKGYRIFMLSNTNAIMFPHIEAVYFTQQGLGLRDYFDRVFLSYEMKAVKPAPEIYRKMIAESGIIPSESLFIDDSPANIATGKELGFHTYHAGEGEDFRPVFDRYTLLK